MSIPPPENVATTFGHAVVPPEPVASGSAPASLKPPFSDATTASGTSRRERTSTAELSRSHMDLLEWLMITAYSFQDDTETLDQLASLIGTDRDELLSTIRSSRNPTEAASHFSRHDVDFSRVATLRSGDTFGHAVQIVLESEGGFSNHRSDRGGATLYGISANANPDLRARILSGDFTREDAIEVYRARYWNQIDGIENLSTAAAVIAFDAAVNHGVGTANRMLRETGGDPVAMMEWREDRYAAIIRNDPSQSVFRNGWENRLERLETAIAQLPTATTTV